MKLAVMLHMEICIKHKALALSTKADLHKQQLLIYRAPDIGIYLVF
jgi:hypothetical protein